MGEIFISYASADALAAVHVAGRVRGAGHHVFLDSDCEDGIAPGVGWRKTLLRELRLCDAVVFLNSSASRVSMWCHSELVVAIELGKRVYSLDLSPGCPPHPLLSSLQGIRFETTVDDGIGRLTGQLRLDGLAEGARFRWERGRAPYPGLAAMDVDDAGVFFGREDEVRNLVARVDGPLGRPGGNLIVVMGPSGAGKSSLVRAGLVARLAVPQSGWAVVRPFEPGTCPLARLASRLANLVPGQLSDGECQDRLLGEGLAALGEWLADHIEFPTTRMLVTVDQAEQLATTAAPSDAKRFLAVLGRCLQADSQVTVVMTVRSDRFDEIQHLPVLGPMIHAPFVIAPMRRSQLGAVIEGPASRADLAVAPGLTARLIEDAQRGGSGQTVDALPFLAFTLREMYDLVAQEGRSSFTDADYERVGRVEGAIIRRTEVAESLLPAGSGPILELLLPRFVALTEDRLPASRAVPRARLTAAEQIIIEKLESQRLLTGTGDAVRLAHEQLITSWPRLARTIAERRDDLVLQARIERQAGDWQHGNGELLGRDAVATAASWLARQHEFGAVGGAAGAYIRASLRALRHRRARLVGVLATIVALALAASALAVTAKIQSSDAIRQSHMAQAETRVAQSEEMAAGATKLFSASAPLAMLIAVQADRRARTMQARSALIEAAEEPLHRLLAAGSTVNAMAFSPDGQTIAAATYDGYIGLWNTANGRRTALLFQGESINSVAFSPDGRVLAAGSDDGHIGLWDTASHRQTATLAGSSSVFSVAFSPGGRVLAAGSDDGHISLWDAATRHRTATLMNGSHVSSVAFSPNGRTLATGDGNGNVRLWDTVSGRRTATLADSSAVTGVAFSPDGQTVAAAMFNARIVLWDTRSGRTATLTQGATVTSVAFSPDGQTVAAGNNDGYIGLWDSVGDRTANLAQGATVESVAFSPDSRALAAGDDDGHIGLWDTASGRRTATLADSSAIHSVAFSPDGRILAAADGDGHIGLWDTASGRRTATLADSSAADSVAFSPDGSILAAGDGDGHIGLWDTASGVRTSNLAQGATVTCVAFSPDGSILAAADDDGYVSLWNTVSGRRTATLTDSTAIYAVAFSPDGRILAAADYDGYVGLWDTASGRRTATLADSSAADSVAFSPDGHTLAYGSDDGHVGLWDTASHRRTATLAGSSPVEDVTFSPDGNTLAIGHEDGSITLLRQGIWNLSSNVLSSRICSEVHRDMTKAEWAANVPGQRYQKTCSAK